MNHFAIRFVSAAALLTVAACEGGEGGWNAQAEARGESYSESVPMAVTGVDERDVRKGWLLADADANAATGGAWEAFVSSAEAECGAPPAGFEVEGVSVSLEVLEGLISADAVVDGDLSLFLCDRPLGDPAAVVVSVASSADLGDLARGSATLDVVAEPGDLEPLYERLLDGTFYVGISGEASGALGQLFVVDAAFDVRMRAICP